MSEHISSYPNVYAVGHRQIADIFKSPVLVEEKVDGSQFSMCRVNGELQCRSKGATLVVDAPEKMFAKAVENARQLDLHDGWVYRCEYLQKPKHNALAYDRVPQGNLILFDVMIGVETYLGYDEKAAEAKRIGLEVVPKVYEGVVSDVEFFKGFLERVSVLGGCKIEGVVVKNYALFTGDKKVAIGKYVSEAFKEVHKGEWRKSNPTNADIVDQLIVQYRTPARWQKAVQHLKESGGLEGSPRDIGPLIKEVPVDVLKECEEEIKEKLFKFFWPKVQRGIVAGLAEWYKEELAKEAFK